VLTATKSGWTFVGWNTNKDATSALSSLTMKTRNVTLYAIFRKEARVITMKFYKNGASTQTNESGTAVGDNYVTRSCTILAVYNNTTQSSSCHITSPVIVASSNTPTVIGYSASASNHSNIWSPNTSKSVTTSDELFAQTKKDGFSRSVSYYAWEGVDDHGDGGTGGNSKPFNISSCNIATVYNGASQATGCDVTLITAQAKTGYKDAKWYVNINGTGTPYLSGSRLTLNGEISVLFGIAKRNFTCAKAGETTTYGKREWYTVANDGTNCTLALNALSTSTGTYAEATTKLTSEYFVDDPQESTLLNEKNAGLTTVLGTYTAGTGIPSGTTGVIWTGANSAVGVNRAFPYYSNKTAGLYYSTRHVTDGNTTGSLLYSNFVTGYNTLSTSTCSSVSGSNCVINNGKVTTYTVSNHGSESWTTWQIADTNSNKKFTINREKAIGSSPHVFNTLGQYSLYLYDCGGTKHNNVSYSIIARNDSSVTHNNYFTSPTSTSTISAINKHYWRQAGVSAGATTTVTNGTQRTYNTGTDASCIPTYTTAFSNATYTINYRLYIRVKI